MPAIMWLLGVSQGCTRADTKMTYMDIKGEVIVAQGSRAAEGKKCC